jgi:hypothetical protein
VTSAKTNHKAARALLLRHLDMHPGQVESDLDPAEVGIVGDTAHAQGGDSYHLGADQIRSRGGRDRYSVDESARDKRGLDNYASGMDVGWFRVTTSKGVADLRSFSLWLVELCKANDPDTDDLREVIYSPDGRTVKRWDRLGRRTTGDSSHLFHTHLSEHRDADGHRMLRLATRWLQHIGLIPEEDDMDQDTFNKLFRNALKEPDIRADMKVIAGQGWHNQRLGASPETAGQDAQGDDAAVATGFAEVRAELDAVKAVLADVKIAVLAVKAANVDKPTA